MTTAILLALITGTIVVSLWFWCVFLAMGFRWVKFQDYTKKKLVVCVLLVFAINLAANIGLRVLFARNEQQPAPSAFAFEEESQRDDLTGPISRLIVGIIIQVSLIAGVFKLGWGKSFRAWLPTLIPGAIIGAYLVLVIRPFVFEAYEIPTNSMAPTVLGEHWVGRCSKCGGLAYGRPWDEETQSRYPYHMTICENFHLNTGEDFREETIGGDCILAMKFLKPRRWDIIVFRFPEDPSRMYVQRLIGLPGEKVVIDEGVVWIDGKPIDPPRKLEGIEYRFVSERDQWMCWGTKERPAVLGETQYFTLGDFSLQSLDSRYWRNPMWEDEPPVDAPYAIPEENIIGVVTHRYWPPSRWEILR